MHILDDIIDKLVRSIFAQMKGVSRQELISEKYEREVAEREIHITQLRTQYEAEVRKLATLKEEIVSSIQGKSAFTKELLAELIAESEEKCKTQEKLLADAELELENSEAVLNDISSRYDELISWADLYDTASFEAKKMIVNCLIKRVEVYRDYKLKVEFNFDLSQFNCGLNYAA